MLSEDAWTEIARSLKLSGRELQILRGVFDDRTESALAADLAISPHTVHTYFERLHRKLAAANRVKLVLRVMAEFMALRDLVEVRDGSAVNGNGPLRSPAANILPYRT